MDRVSVDLTDIKILFDLGDVRGLDPVGDAPDLAVLGCGVRVGQGGPEGPLD